MVPTGNKIEHLSLHKKMKFSIEDFFRKCDRIRRETVNLVKFTEESLNGKLLCLCSERCSIFFRRNWHCSGIFIVTFEHILHLFLVFLLLTLSR